MIQRVNSLAPGEPRSESPCVRRIGGILKRQSKTPRISSARELFRGRHPRFFCAFSASQPGSRFLAGQFG